MEENLKYVSKTIKVSKMYSTFLSGLIVNNTIYPRREIFDLSKAKVLFSSSKLTRARFCLASKECLQVSLSNNINIVTNPSVEVGG